MGSEMGKGHIGVCRGCYASCARPSDTSQGIKGPRVMQDA